MNQSSYSSLLSAEDYAAVIAAAPDIQSEDRELAKHILDHLENVGADFHSNGGYYEVPLKSVAESAGETPARVGRIMGDLGLVKQRRRDGYHIFFTARQMEIIDKSLEVDRVH